MKEAIITLRIKQPEKEYLIKKSEEEGVSLSEYIFRRILPEKYKSVIEWEKKLSS